MICGTDLGMSAPWGGRETAGYSRKDHRAQACEAGRYEKELPQPQLRVTFGLLMWNPAPCKVSR